MGVSLDYWTTGPVPTPVKEAIESEAGQLAPANDWWAEPLIFFDSGPGDRRLHGATKIFLVGYSTDDGGYIEVDADDDTLMAYRDACFILGKLVQWSEKHGVSWDVHCAGEPIGTISKGRWDGPLREYVDAMKRSFPWPSSFDDAVKAISAKYASRWGGEDSEESDQTQDTAATTGVSDVKQSLKRGLKTGLLLVAMLLLAALAMAACQMFGGPGDQQPAPKHGGAVRP